MSLSPEELNKTEQSESRFKNTFKSCLVKFVAIFGIPLAVSGGAAVGMGIAPEGWELLGAGVGGGIPAVGSVVLLWADSRRNRNTDDN
ncbi:MAG TPA: hypothetical protein PLS49_07615 [Candidatus Woesebacteria bacterium]|nr:hypothetical protein [Candidatus Woesebacteria bacterium]